MHSAHDYDRRRRERLSGERLLFAKSGDAPTRVCLVYPNRYALGMGNLGFQAVYEIFDRTPGVTCERAFLPEPDEMDIVARRGLRTIESDRSVGSADILAFSISFEVDYLNVPRLLELSGLAPRAAERSRGPLVMAGGPAVFLNPEPVADFFDLFLIGEAEEMLPEFLERWAAFEADRRALLTDIDRSVAGAYVPDAFSPVYEGPVLLGRQRTRPGPAQVRRRLVWDLNRFPTATRVLNEEAVFGDMVMVEASRGCQWGCRFCAAGFMYRPIRTRDPRQLADTLDESLAHRATIGLVGAEMASVPGVDALAERATQRGGRLSPSSLKADCVTPRLASVLVGGGTRSVTVAPEAGSERMRRVINKNLSEVDILRAAELLMGEGVQDLKCYFMFGLPTEEAEDLDAIVDLVIELRRRLCESGRARGRVGRVTVSLNPFVPKPWTPFQWDPMQSIADLRRKMRFLQRRFAVVPNARLDIESPREAYLQTLLSRGDRRTSRFIEAVHVAGGDWWRTIRIWQRDGLDGLPHPDGWVHREYAESEEMPWDFIDHRIDKRYLWIERRKALSAHQTPPCDTSTCRSCAAC